MPQVFISYAWESDAHHQWVEQLAVRLGLADVDVVLDKWKLLPGDEIAVFMESSVINSDFVLVICTPTYKLKSERRAGGVGYEGTVMTAEILRGKSRRKFIPILCSGDWSESAPAWLAGSLYVDLRPEHTENGYRVLLNAIQGVTSGPKSEIASSPNEAELRSSDRLASEVQTGRVLVEMLTGGRGDMRTQERAVEWLHSSIGSPTWPHVARAYLDARADPSRIEHLVRDWLYSNESHSGWTEVWLAMMNAQRGGDWLEELGQRFLDRNR